MEIDSKFLLKLMIGIKFLTTLVVAGIALTGCQQKVKYMTPEITGQVIDRETDKPIAGVKAFLASEHYDITGQDGMFLIPAIEYRYRVSPPEHFEYGAYNDASLIFMSDDYKHRLYRSGALPSTNIDQNQETYNENIKTYVNMGKVYLTPVDPNQTEPQEEYIEGPIEYCLPNQSQKVVNCIPLPKNMTYDQAAY